MKGLKGRDQLFVGLTLFSMFFGAGNLIFPPLLGAQAGEKVWWAMVGMALSAVALPVLGVVAVARAGGLPKLARRVHPVFEKVFVLAAYLAIGPCLAIPRTASTSFQMAVTPFAGETGLGARAVYSLVFFAVSLAVALKPDKLTDRLGKFTAPALLVLICVLTGRCMLAPPGGYGEALTEGFRAHAAAQGFLDGYQTMDAIAALVFGIVIAVNIRSRGVEEEREVVRATVRAGWIAGGVLLAVYAALAHVGAVCAGAYGLAEGANGAGVLTQLALELFGRVGIGILGAVFVIACFNTCTGLISSCGEYFCQLFPALGYRAWACVFAAVSFGISIAGLDAILKVSVPVLGMLYPPAIVLILLGLGHRWLEGLRFVYPVTVLTAAAVSVAGALFPALPLPLAGMGLGWVAPTLMALAASVGLSLGARSRDGNCES